LEPASLVIKKGKYSEDGPDFVKHFETVVLTELGLE